MFAVRPDQIVFQSNIRIPEKEVETGILRKGKRITAVNYDARQDRL